MSASPVHWLLQRQTVRKLARRLIERMQPLARELLAAPQSAPPAGGQPDPTVIPEITALTPRASERPDDAARLTLLIPGLSERHVFGGIATALQFFDHLRSAVGEVRIVVLDEMHIEPRRDAYYSDWPVYALADLHDRDPAGAHVAVAGNRATWTLPVRDGDLFVATSWWSAHLAHRLLDWQQHAFPARARRLAYLIQDFEPGFYAWSSRYALAAATYGSGERTLAVVNSGFLADFLTAQGHRFARTWVFEPRLNPALAARRGALGRVRKKRSLLVYGRPGTERNAFAVLVAGLRQWAAREPASTRWRVVSAGEEHADIDLGGGLRLESLGKLPLDSYAQLLAESAVGVSLMISPHPSYPPLEMAAFGCRVVSNRFATKDLSRLSPAIVAVDPVNADALADAILRQCAAWDAQAGAAGEAEIDLNGVSLGSPFLDGGDPFGFAGSLCSQWLADCGLAPAAAGL